MWVTLDGRSKVNLDILVLIYPFFLSFSSVTSMLDHLEWESLEARRTKCQLTMMFKIINDLVDIP